MSHYICTGGCMGVNDTPGSCQDEECLNYGEPLEICECTDDQHGGAFDEMEDDDDEDE